MYLAHSPPQHHPPPPSYPQPGTLKRGSQAGGRGEVEECVGVERVGNVHVNKKIRT